MDWLFESLRLQSTLVKGVQEGRDGTWIASSGPGWGINFLFCYDDAGGGVNQNASTESSWKAFHGLMEPRSAGTANII